VLNWWILRLVSALASAMSREESWTSAEEAVFGSQLVLPGQLLDLTPADESFTSALKQVMSGIQPLPTVHNASAGQLPDALPEDLLPHVMSL
jgi:hypothetical protein